MSHKAPTGEITLEGLPIVDGKPARVLVVDDSAPSRAVIAETLEEGGCVVVGRAMDGLMALKILEHEQPDVITLDLEMPRMDGFTFLRVLRRIRHIPVIILTSDARPEAALMALELGAHELVLKPKRPTEIKAMGAQLISRVRALLGVVRAAEVATHAAAHAVVDAPTPTERAAVFPPHVAIVCIGTSTGGPAAMRELVARLEGPPRCPIAIVQHMPVGFTSAYAERLRRHSGLDVAEARDGELALPGTLRVAPAGSHLEVVAMAAGELCYRLRPPSPSVRWTPSVDLLFSSAARAVGSSVLGVVLTGMGRDGQLGARDLDAVGAPLWAESHLTAIVDGMPNAAASAHGGSVRLAFDDLIGALARGLKSTS